VRGFFTGFDRQYQSDLTMERVYGDVTYAERVGGGSVRYAQPLGRGISLDAVAGYAFTHGHYRDVSTCNYDWYGRCFTENAPGEIDQNPHDQRSWEHAAFARLYGQWDLAPGHALRLSIAPTYTTRSGNNLRGDLPGIRDPLTAERDLFSMVTGLEYQCDLLGDRLENIAFIKHYLQRLSAEDPELNLFVRDDRHTQRPGFGDSLRYRFRDGLYAKASYEWATRLPRPVEVFGDNAFILPNLALVPETSHNANLGITVDDARTPLGAFDASATGFLRVADQLIAPFGASATQTYENVFGARSLGAEATAAWTSPGDHVMLDGSATYEDFRNRSPEGPYSFYNGDRVPNLPYLFGSASARFKLRDLIVRDELVLSFRSRYVHSFFRTWESAGIPSLKQTIPSQLVHSIGAAYLVRTERGTLSTTLEVSNLTDEAVFDYFGLQRPGRAFYVKTALEF
jgi:hypothetical protein